MRSTYRFWLWGSIATTVMLSSSAGFAQDAEEADGNVPEQSAQQGGPIVVTARKRKENLIDVPLPVTVATAEQLERDQVYSLTDLQRLTPALEMSQTNGADTNGGGRLRGIGTGVFNPSVSPSVAIVIDQVPIGNLAFPQIYDMAQVEVLRGPQGTLFGQGASGGVINISTRAPELGRLGANATVDWADKGTAGSEIGEFIVNAGVNIPLGDSVAVRVATQYRDETGLQRSATTGEDNSIEDWSIRGRILFEPNDWLTATLSLEHMQNTSNGQTFFAIAVAPNSTTPFGPPGGTLGGISTGAYTNPAGCALPVISERAEFYCEADPSYLETEVQAYSLILDIDLSEDLSLTSVTGYRDRRFDEVHRDFSRILPQPAAQRNRNRNVSDGFSQELRLAYVGNSVDVVAGAFYQDYSLDRNPMGTPLTFGSNLPGERIGFSVCNPAGTFCPVGTRFVDETTQNRIYALFADATVSVTDQFSVFGGLRFDDYKNTTTIQTFPAVPGDAGGAPSPLETFTTEDSNISGRIGVSYQPNPDTNIFASYARGYKPPAVGTNPAGDLFQLDPEKANAFELGARFNLADIQLSGNIFYTELFDFQSQTSVFVGTALISQPLNIDQLEAYGFELGAQGEVFPGLTLNAGYQYNHLVYPDGYLGDDGGLLGGTQFLHAPRHKFTLSGDFTQPLTEDIDFFINANLIYKSETLKVDRADPRYRYPAHELINGGIGLRAADGSWNASVFVRNLTKEREPTSMLASTFAGQVDGGIRYWPIAGLTARVVGLRVGFEF